MFIYTYTYNICIIYVYTYIYIYNYVCVHKRVQPSNPQITGVLPTSHNWWFPTDIHILLHSQAGLWSCTPPRLPFTSMDTSTPVWFRWMSDPVPFLRSAASAAEHRKIFFSPGARVLLIESYVTKKTCKQKITQSNLNNFKEWTPTIISLYQLVNSCMSYLAMWHCGYTQKQLRKWTIASTFVYVRYHDIWKHISHVENIYHLSCVSSG
jgi:hypothetical protein